MTERPGRLFALVLGLALLAAALERTALAVRSGLAEPARGASWIWAPGLERSPDPVAFFAVRDVRIAGIERAAEIAIAGDESYVLYVNGRRVGSGGYRRRAPSDLYDVTADLEPGWNRLAVELASRRGAGGLVARLDVDGRTLAVTDAGWRIFRRFEAGLLRGWSLEGGEPAKVWRRPPTGRWRLAPPARRAVFPVELAPPPLRTAKRVRALAEAEPWFDLGPFRDNLPRGFGNWMLFDWGEEVTGYLTLEIEAASADAGVLHAGTEIPDPAAPCDALIVRVPGRDLWIDAFPRTFRYAFVAALELSRPPVVLLADPDSARRTNPALERPGVFGLAPPGGHTLEELEILRRMATGMGGDE